MRVAVLLVEVGIVGAGCSDPLTCDVVDPGRDVLEFSGESRDAGPTQNLSPCPADTMANGSFDLVDGPYKNMGIASNNCVGLCSQVSPSCTVYPLCDQGGTIGRWVICHYGGRYAC